MAALLAHPTAPAADASRARRVALTVLLVLVSALFLFVGVPKILGLDYMVTGMAEMNYGPGVTRLIGVLEVLAVVGLWWPRTRTLVLTGLLLVMAGAAGSHLGAGDPPTGVVPLFVIALVLAATAWADRGDHLTRFLFPSA